MKIARVSLLALSATITVTFVLLVRAEAFPLGVRGEWVWSRIHVAIEPLNLLIAAFGVLLYSGFVALGSKRLEAGGKRSREARWVGGLAVAAILVQIAAQSGAPTGFGLTKWVTLGLHGSSGYFEVAKTQIRDPWRFWAEYPRWIETQDPLHVGTHPPGLFLASRAVLGTMEAHPEWARRIVEFLPGSVSQGLREMIRGGTLPERAAYALMGMLTLLACSATVIPLYLLTRASLPASTAWAAAALWPLVPSAILFQPTADSAFPFLATSALALAAWGGFGRSLAAGAVLGLGMQFTLAFLPVGLAVAIIHASRSGDSRRRRGMAIVATGIGFSAFTLAVWVVSRANPLVIWWWNHRNHARFYVVAPKSYLAWVAINPIELVVALGLPSAVLAAVGFSMRKAPRSAWAALLVIALLNLSGKNLSEVARLWLPLIPGLLAASAAGIARIGGKSGSLAALILFVGVQTVALESMVQVVYPMEMP